MSMLELCPTTTSIRYGLMALYLALTTWKVRTGSSTSTMSEFPQHSPGPLCLSVIWPVTLTAPPKRFTAQEAEPLR